MASKKNPAAEEKTEGTELTETAENTTGTLTAAELLAQKQQAEIERLKRELAEARKPAPARKTDKQIVQEAIETAIAEKRNLWDVKVPVRSRPRVGTTEKHYWLGVNGRFLALPADDKYYDLALPFAECLVKAMDAERFVSEYADKNIRVYDLITNPHEEEREI